MQQAKMAGIACLIAVTVLGAGYLWGARGRWAAQDRLAAVERQAALSETRRLTLAGQMALTRLNFGEAAGLFESARAGADAAAKGLEHEGLPELAGQAATAAQALTEARGLAAKLDQGSAGKAGDALALLDRTAAALRERLDSPPLLVRRLRPIVWRPGSMGRRLSFVALVVCLAAVARGARLALASRSITGADLARPAKSSACRLRRLRTSSPSACPTRSSPRLTPKSD